jgi:hypothetical protein
MRNMILCRHSPCISRDSAEISTFSHDSRTRARREEKRKKFFVRQDAELIVMLDFVADIVWCGRKSLGLSSSDGVSTVMQQESQSKLTFLRDLYVPDGCLSFNISI